MKLKILLFKFFRFLGFQVSYNSGENEILNFVKKCHPMNTDIPLKRFGENSDGGYVVPDDLDGISYCFSPGIDYKASFELDLAQRNIISFMADYSVDGAPISNPNFRFEKKFLGICNDEVYVTLDSWVDSKKIGNGEDLILQMDIEGAEYDTILFASDDTISKFRIIVIEFHGLDELINKKGLQIIRATFNRLLKNHTIVHIHPNNISPIVRFKGIEIPPTMEFTFLRNDRIMKSSYSTEFPNCFDHRCVEGLPDIRLPKTWYYNL